MGGQSPGLGEQRTAPPRIAASEPRNSVPAAGPGPRSSPVRVASLLGVAVLLAIMIVPTLRAYIGQREEHARLLASVEEQHRDVEELARQLGRLRDPAYKEQLARSRLHMVRPGETPYGVIRPDGSGPIASAPGGSLAAPPVGQATTQNQAWYSSVMSRMQRVDEGRSTPTSTVLPGRMKQGSPEASPSMQPSPVSTATAPAGR